MATSVYTQSDVCSACNTSGNQGAVWTFTIGGSSFDCSYESDAVVDPDWDDGWDDCDDCYKRDILTRSSHRSSLGTSNGSGPGAGGLYAKVAFDALMV